MGKCQSGFCLNRVIEEIATARGITLEDVRKELNNSNQVNGDIRK